MPRIILAENGNEEQDEGGVFGKIFGPSLVLY